MIDLGLALTIAIGIWLGQNLLAIQRSVMDALADRIE